MANLAKVGYTAFTGGTFFTKWTGVGTSQQPSYITCADCSCTTVEYKAGTRKHIEDLRLRHRRSTSGTSGQTCRAGTPTASVKLPNPTYYLPSPGPARHERAGLAPRTHFTMEPDGSSGADRGR